MEKRRTLLVMVGLRELLKSHILPLTGVNNVVRHDSELGIATLS